MSLSKEERAIITSNLSEKERKELRKCIDKMHAIYLLTDRERGEWYERWMHDSERFIGFTYWHTRALVKHSITLSRLTWGLVGVSVVLAAVAIVQIIYSID